MSCREVLATGETEGAVPVLVEQQLEAEDQPDEADTKAPMERRERS